VAGLADRFGVVAGCCGLEADILLLDLKKRAGDFFELGAEVPDVGVVLRLRAVPNERRGVRTDSMRDDVQIDERERNSEQLGRPARRGHGWGWAGLVG